MNLSKREQFALAAIQGMQVNPESLDWTFEQIAKWSFKQADAMLAESAKNQAVKDRAEATQ